jgi:hypothetical protein
MTGRRKQTSPVGSWVRAIPKDGVGEAGPTTSIDRGTVRFSYCKPSDPSVESPGQQSGNNFIPQRLGMLLRREYRAIAFPQT